MQNFYFPPYDITLQKDLKTSSLLLALCVKQKFELSACSSLVPTLGLPHIADSVVSKTDIAWQQQTFDLSPRASFQDYEWVISVSEEQLAAKYVLFFGGAKTALIKANSQSFGI